MKKYLLLILLLPTLALGQRSSFSQSFDIAIPNGFFSSSAQTGWGTSFRFHYSLSKRVSGIGSIGYISFGKKSYSSTIPPIYTISTKSKMIPFQIGLKYYLITREGSPQHGLFLSGEIGFHVLTGEATVNGVEKKIPNEADFSYAPGIGYQIAKFEFSYRQQFITSSGNSINYSSIRIAWMIYGKVHK